MMDLPHLGAELCSPKRLITTLSFTTNGNHLMSRLLLEVRQRGQCMLSTTSRLGVIEVIQREDVDYIRVMGRCRREVGHRQSRR
jgi:hypothetical protein